MSFEQLVYVCTEVTSWFLRFSSSVVWMRVELAPPGVLAWLSVVPAPSAEINFHLLLNGPSAAFADGG